VLRTGSTAVITYDHSGLLLDLAADVRTFSNSAGTEQARFTSSGNLLIGTTTDSGIQLHISPASGSVIAGISGRTDSGAATYGVLQFSTRDAGSYTERMRLTSDGKLQFDATNGVGIQFPSDLASTDANTLDDYEEGTFTPVFSCATPGNLVATGGTATGKYTKIGSLVDITLRIDPATFTHTTASGEVRITGLPFTSGAYTNKNVQGALSWGGWSKPANAFQMAARVEPSKNYVTLVVAFDNNSSLQYSQIGEWPTGGAPLIDLSLQYYTIA
jgi:hypothetical protein